MRLTVHIENAPFKEVEQTSARVYLKDADGNQLKDGKNYPIWNTVYKPKKSKCIINTLSFKGLMTQKDVEEAMADVRSKHTIAKWDTGDRAGQEQIYVCNEK